MPPGGFWLLLRLCLTAIQSHARFSTAELIRPMTRFHLGYADIMGPEDLFSRRRLGKTDASKCLSLWRPKRYRSFVRQNSTAQARQAQTDGLLDGYIGQFADLTGDSHSLGQGAENMRKRMVPGLAFWLGKVGLGPSTGFQQRLRGVAAEFTPADDVGPEEVDEG